VSWPSLDEAKAGKPIPLFKLHRAGIADAEQKRDFIHVDDAIAVVVRWLMATADRIGYLQCRNRMRARLPVEYVERPESIRHAYQYFTQAETSNLRAGFSAPFMTLEQGVESSLCHYLNRGDRFR
jgi:ADP-L-glycero-D-manno-heptose 6-epimerase